MPDIHITDVQQFVSCRRRWDYSSMLRQGLESKRMYGPFVTGRAIHAAIESWYASNTPLETTIDAFFEHTKEELKQVGTFDRYEAEFLEEYALSSSMAKYYQFWSQTYKGPYCDSDLEYVSLETPFRVQFGPKGARKDIYLAGRFDGVVKNLRDDSLWLLETKTANTQFDTYEQFLDRNIQATAYVIAAQHVLQQNVAGVMYNILRKKLITPPKELKDGYLSKNKSQAIPIEYYIAAIRKHHQSDLEHVAASSNGNGSEAVNQWIKNNYGDVIEAMTLNPQVFIKRVTISKTDEEKRNFMRELWDISLQMVDPRVSTYRNESQFTCGWCPFKTPCAVAKAGGDEQQVLRLDFQRRTQEVHIAQLEV